MDTSTFYSYYASVPLANRNMEIIVGDRVMTLNEIYDEISRIEDKIRPDVCRKDELLMAWEWHKIKDKQDV